MPLRTFFVPLFCDGVECYYQVLYMLELPITSFPIYPHLYHRVYSLHRIVLQHVQPALKHNANERAALIARSMLVPMMSADTADPSTNTLAPPSLWSPPDLSSTKTQDIAMLLCLPRPATNKQNQWQLDGDHEQQGWLGGGQHMLPLIINERIQKIQNVVGIPNQNYNPDEASGIGWW